MRLSVPEQMRPSV